MAGGRGSSGMVPEMWDSVRLCTASTHGNAPGKYGPHGELFYFLLMKVPTVISELVEFGPVSQPKQ